ncbi:hypothetical protein D4R86_02195 [bacterium]|nr:MAG: hypothetical protein D4R86_02195 [bacterium]
MFKIKITSEVHCDLCNEIIHNHFDCPVCEQKWASGNFIDLNEKKPCILKCHSCGAEFITTDPPYASDTEWEEMIKTKGE